MKKKDKRKSCYFKSAKLNRLPKRDIKKSVCHHLYKHAVKQYFLPPPEKILDFYPRGVDKILSLKKQSKKFLLCFFNDKKNYFIRGVQIKNRRFYPGGVDRNCTDWTVWNCLSTHYTV